MSWKSLKMATVSRLFCFVLYSEPATQKPALVAKGPPQDANPSVNDRLCTYTATARPESGAPSTSFSVLPAVVKLYSTCC